MAHKKRILGIADGVTPTGFARVAHSIFERLPVEEFDVNHLAINYYGDPHDHHWKIYPASIGGDLWGYNRIKDFVDRDMDTIFILNDPWVIDAYLDVIQKHFKKDVPPIIVYFPVDASSMDKRWFSKYDLVKSVNVYTQFGYDELTKLNVVDKDIINIVPHGLDRNLFFKINEEKRKLKSMVYPDREDYLDSFIVLNANRNQPRKRIDLTMEGFALFAEGKPENVKLYLHMGTKDVGIEILHLAEQLKISDRLVLTSLEKNVQRIPISRLNLIYNATDVGINTGFGEGWSLTNMEHAISGAPQVVPDHSALTELYDDCGILIPINQYLRNLDVGTIGGLVKQEDIAEKLELLYTDKKLYSKLSKKSIEKFTNGIYDWDNIVKEHWLPIFEKV